VPLTREQILSSTLPIEEVPTPEWGGSVFVRTVTVADRLALESAIERHKADPFATVILVFTLCDEAGVPLFGEGQKRTPEEIAADVALLNHQNPAPMVRAAKVASRLNAIKSDDLDELEKNS
jgi:hypothetical protein